LTAKGGREGGRRVSRRQGPEETGKSSNGSLGGEGKNFPKKKADFALQGEDQSSKEGGKENNAYLLQYS